MRDETVIVESVTARAEAAAPAAAASLSEAEDLGKTEKRAEAALADPPFGAGMHEGRRPSAPTAYPGSQRCMLVQA